MSIPVPQLTKIQHSHDEVVNRVQDQLTAKVNPFIARQVATNTEHASILSDHTTILNELTAGKEVTGAKGGNAALTDLITVLHKLGIIKDSTT